MLTNEERLIYDMLSAKIGYVPVLSIETSEKLKKNVIKELFKTLLNTRLYELLKKKFAKNSSKIVRFLVL
jgi:hypothetical protein